MGILKVAGKVLLIPLWFIISIIGVGEAISTYGGSHKKNIGIWNYGVVHFGTVICYQRAWLSSFFCLCMESVLILSYLPENL